MDDMQWNYHFQKRLPTEAVYAIAAFAGSMLPLPSPNKIQILRRHFQKRYCKTCGEYMSVHNTHRHSSRQKFFRYRPKYEDYLRVHEMFYISKTKYRMVAATPYDMIVLWQNTRVYYSSFRRCLNHVKYTKIHSFHDVYFTDIGISSTTSFFWYVDNWNQLYPNMKYAKSHQCFDFCQKDYLWTPDLNII
jgi:hypothetical protein